MQCSRDIIGQHSDAFDEFPECRATEEEVLRAIQVYFVDSAEESPTNSSVKSPSKAEKCVRKKIFKKQFVKGVTQESAAAIYQDEPPVSQRSTHPQLIRSQVSSKQHEELTVNEVDIARNKEEGSRALPIAKVQKSSSYLRRKIYKLKARTNKATQQQSMTFNSILNTLGGL